MITPGYILTDEDGAHVGLTLADVAVIVAEWDRDAARATLHDVKVGTLRIRWRNGLLVWRHDECGEDSPQTVVTTDDIAEMRKILEDAS